MCIRDRNLPFLFNEPILKTKAELVSSKLKMQTLKAAYCLYKFKQRHQLTVGKDFGKTKDVHKNVTSSWSQKKWPKIRECYEETNIFNADETGHFINVPKKDFEICG